jgi:superfamily II DNA helicase RecQ
VITVTLKTGIDVLGITHVMHLKAPYSIIDYIQEVKRVKRARERVTAMIIVKDKD